MPMRDRALSRLVFHSSFFANFLLGAGVLVSAPVAQAALPSEFHIETPVAGADLQAQHTVLALQNCKAPKGASAPEFRLFLDGEKMESRPLTRSRVAMPSSWWLGLELPDDISSEAPHRITVEAVCGERARVATLEFSWRNRGGLETALGLARSFRVRSRSDTQDWSPASGMVAWGLDALREFAPLAEQKVLGDWLQGYHRSWAARPDQARKVDQPGDLLPGVSMLGLAFEQQITPVFERFKELVWFLKTQPLNAQGAIDRWGSTPLAWARAKGIEARDLLNVGVFAALAAARLGDRDLLEFAARQPFIHADKLRDPISGLYHQVWLESLDAPQNEGSGFSLRVNGQVLFALIAIAEALPSGHASRGPIIDLALDLRSRLLAHQLPSGGFPLGAGSRYLQEEEVSASAWIGAALARGVRGGILPPLALDEARGVWNYLVARVNVVETKGALPLYGIGPIARLTRKPDRLQGDLENAAHGVGPVLLLAAELQGLGGF